MLRIEFLGTGTSQGVPEIACDCEVCQSSDPWDNRLRSSIWVQTPEISLILDVTPDFRQQALRAGISRVDAVLLTHLHADHFLGIDDLRRFNRLQKSSIPVYLAPHMEEQFRNVFGYALGKPAAGLYRPQLELRLNDRSPVHFGSLCVTPVPLDHGCGEILGYLFACEGTRVAYLSDCKRLPPYSFNMVREADVIILGAIWDRDQSHRHHLNLDEARELAEELQGKQTYLTHITHRMGQHAQVNTRLAEHLQLAHDRQVLHFN